VESNVWISFETKISHSVARWALSFSISSVGRSGCRHSSLRIENWSLRREVSSWKKRGALSRLKGVAGKGTNGRGGVSQASEEKETT